MEPSIPSLPRAARRRLMRVVHKTRDKDHARRALASLRLAEGLPVSEVARRLCAVRSTVYRWRGGFECEGERGLESTAPGRAPWTLTPAVAERLGELLRERPRVFGYLRSRWSSQMLARELTVQLGVLIHSSTVRRWLPRLGFPWRRARPTLCKRDPAKAEKLTAIAQALARASGREPVFYVDEADTTSISTPASVRLGCAGASRRPSPPRAPTRSATWPGHSMPAPGRWRGPRHRAKALTCSSRSCASRGAPTARRAASCSSWTTTSSTPARLHADGWRRSRSSSCCSSPSTTRG